MCIFSGAVKRVSGTRIFARHVGEGRQGLVYAMTVAVSEPVAMCLPLPVAIGAGEDAVRFVDLSGYADFFEDCEKLFPRPVSRGGMAAGRAQAMGDLDLLAVHDVGDFVASYVPSPKDFDRLDARFRLPASALAKLPQYADWGFAVFQLAKARPGGASTARPWWKFWAPKPAAVAAGPAADDDPDRAIHPMAFTFPTRYPDALFFPTLHLHDGDAVPTHARYDHTLYCQTSDPRIARTFAWRPSEGKPSRHVAVGKTGGLVDGAAPMYRRAIHTLERNSDQLIHPPACDLAALSVRDELFAFELAATAAYATDLAAAHGEARHATARTRLDDLSAGLARELRALVAAHRSDWQLVPLPKDLTYNSIILSNGRAMMMTDAGPIVLPPGGGSNPCVIRFGAETDRVERQQVAFAFAGAPAEHVIPAIEEQLRAILDRAIA